MAYYDQPELIHDILQTISDTAFRVLERVSAMAPVDMLAVHEDMAGKSGPLAGPAQVREFIAPYYRRIGIASGARGAPVRAGFGWQHEPRHRPSGGWRQLHAPYRASSGYGHGADSREIRDATGALWRDRQARAQAQPRGDPSRSWSTRYPLC